MCRSVPPLPKDAVSRRSSLKSNALKHRGRGEVSSFRRVGAEQMEDEQNPVSRSSASFLSAPFLTVNRVNSAELTAVKITLSPIPTRSNVVAFLAEERGQKLAERGFPVEMDFSANQPDDETIPLKLYRQRRAELHDSTNK